MLDEQKRLQIQAHISTLFQNRLQESINYFQTISEEERIFLIASSCLIDGQYELAEQLYDQIPMTFSVAYNKLKMYEELNSNKALFLEKIMQQKYKSEFENKEKEKLNNKVAYFLSNVSITGGTRMALKNKKILESNGYKVDFFLSHPNADKENIFKNNAFGSSYEAITYFSDEDIPTITADYDIAVAPYFDFFYPLYLNFKKVFYYAQGDYITYSDIPQIVEQLKILHYFPIHIYSVSHFLNNYIQQKFSRETFILPCDIDCDLFYPGEKFEKNSILLVGNGSRDYELKGIRPTISTLLTLVDELNYDIIWVTPNPNDTYDDSRVKVVHHPSQDELSYYYRKSTIYVSGSRIEAFPLPPIEAMASGTCVIAADSGGIHHYGEHGVNLLMYQYDNEERLIEYVSLLLQSKKKRDFLINNGLQTVLHYQPDLISNKFMKYFNEELNKKWIVHYDEKMK